MEQETEKMTGGQVLMVAVLLLGTFVSLLNNTLLNPALPSIMEDLAIDSTVAQWLASGYTLAIAVIIPTSAFLLGRFSAKKLFVGALCLFFVGSLIAGWGANFPVLLVGRLLQGVSVGILLPADATLVVLAMPRNRRGLAMGLVSLAMCVAPAVGPVIAGLLVDHIGWHVMFGSLAGVSVVLTVVALFAIKSPGGFEKVQLDVPSLVLVIVGLGLLLFGLVSIPKGLGAAVCLGCSIVGLVLVALFVKRQGGLETPLLRISVLRTKPLAINSILGLIMQAVCMGVGVVIPLYIQTVLGHSATVNGLTLMPGAAIGAIGSVVAGKLYDRHGARPLAIISGAICLVGLIWISTMDAHTNIVVLTLVYVIYIVGFIVTISLLNAWGLDAVDNGQIQHATALSNTLTQVGGAFGIGILGSIPGSCAIVMEGCHWVFVSAAALIGIVLLVTVLLVRNLKKS